MGVGPIAIWRSKLASACHLLRSNPSDKGEGSEMHSSKPLSIGEGLG